MPRYTVVNAATFVSNNMHAVGDVVDYDGWPGSTLEPADDVAKRIKEHYAANRRRRNFPRKPDLADFAAPKAAPAPAPAPAPEPKPEPEPEPEPDHPPASGHKHSRRKGAP